MNTDERRICDDILAKLQETKQIYIRGFDYPISINKNLFKILDARRREEAKARNIPEEQFEFEDVIGLLLGIPTDPEIRMLSWLKVQEHIKKFQETIQEMILGEPAIFREKSEYDKGYEKGYYDAKEKIDECFAELVRLLK